MRKQCDASYKMVFSSPETVWDLILGFVPDDWLHALDWTTLEKVPSSYITDDLRQRADDVVWRIRADGEWVYCYFLIEFQSTVDPFMAVRIMAYLALLYQDLIRSGEVLPGRRLPPVLPIVMYNGEAAWTAATDIADLILEAPGLPACHRPRLRYFLVDQGQYSDQQLARMHNVVACLFRFEQAPRGEVLWQVVDRLNELLCDNPELKRAFALLLSEVVSRHSDQALSLSKIRELKELRMRLAQRFKEWSAQYRQEGLQAGLQEGRQEGVRAGEAMLFHMMLTERFGPLSPELASTVASATTEQIDVWARRLLRADTLDEIFRP
ncbi:Rpn family recombination-promoting nuclease/putative transposase [Cupriavidus respiraculi]|uniref:Rpn family recombination-promoting nuclease/putative transposase n=1 Tax=Cupriavidus respiraculi TaxID=195930 RepID=UPI001C95553D|nr:Rpn family recombination-promoting nuclease/putative transposase [Cupriavidus respiraculi]MBY4948527.1 Rpn family recombination-promoting nuclease/putative transposase [Cupriavidus respiraculi]